MKKLVLVIMAVCLVASFAMAAESKSKKQAAPAPAAASMSASTASAASPAPAAVVPASENITLTGDIIDNLCAGSQKPEGLAAFVKAHTKQCALMPQCAASGYSIFSNGALAKFDAASSAKIAEFLKKTDSKLQVVVVAKKTGNELNLVSIENQK